MAGGAMSIDVELISFITSLPTMGESLAQYLDEKTKEKSLAEEMKKMYGTKRGSRGIIIKRISDDNVNGHQTHGLQDAPENFARRKSLSGSSQLQHSALVALCSVGPPIY
jgi:hypothetical protein